MKLVTKQDLVNHYTAAPVQPREATIKQGDYQTENDHTCLHYASIVSKNDQKCKVQSIPGVGGHLLTHSLTRSLTHSLTHSPSRIKMRNMEILIKGSSSPGG